MKGTDASAGKGKVGKCVDGTGAGKFLISWDGSADTICDGNELIPAILQNQGWTNQYVWTLEPVIQEVLAKGGVRCCFSTSQDMLNLMDAVQGNYEASLAVFQKCYVDVTGDSEIFQSLQKLSTELPKGKPSQPASDVKDAETLYQQAIATRAPFEEKLNSLALSTGTEPHMGPVKKIFRATEKVTANYSGDWCQLTDGRYNFFFLRAVLLKQFEFLSRSFFFFGTDLTLLPLALYLCFFFVFSVLYSSLNTTFSCSWIVVL